MRGILCGLLDPMTPDTRSSYSGERGTVYSRTQTVMRERQAAGAQQCPKSAGGPPRVVWRVFSFDDVLVAGRHVRFPNGLPMGLGSWDLAGLEPYAPEITSQGFFPRPKLCGHA